MTAILVVLTIIAFATVDLVVMARRRRQQQNSQPVPVAEEWVAMREPRLPYGLFLDNAHSWMRIIPDGKLRLGIDDFLSEAIGRIDEVTLPAQGEKVARGDPLMTLHIGKQKLVVPSPVSGEVVAVNDLVLIDPKAAVVDPYGLGWFVDLWTHDHKEAIRPLNLGTGAVAFLRQEYHRLLEFLTTSASPGTVTVLADGGLPRRGAVASLQSPDWEAFQKQFIKSYNPE